MNKTHLDQINTQTSIFTSRKIFSRKPHSPNPSRNSSSHSLRDKSSISQPSIPYIRLNLLKSENYSQALRLPTHQQSPPKPQSKISEAPGHLTSRKPISRPNPKNSNQEKELTIKVQELLQETIMRQQELNQMTLEKQNLLIELQAIKIKVQIMDESNAETRRNQENLKEIVNKITKQRNSLQGERTTLLKKVAELERKVFPEKPNSLQSLRQQYLQKQLSELKNRLNREKSENQKSLEVQVSDLREKLFNANKLIQNLRINNRCLHQKNQNLSHEIRNTPELVGLKSKYKKTLEQKNELKRLRETTIKQIDSLVDQNQRLKKELIGLKQLTICEQSLNFSMASNISQLVI